MDEKDRLLMTEAYNRLKELNDTFNMTRLIMTDADLRKEAGEMVVGNREFLQRLGSALILLRRQDSAEGSKP